MKPLRASVQVFLVTASFTMLAIQLARGDGGVVQLHESKGPFSVTVFVPLEMARGELADVSVLVQWRNNRDVVLDADVSLAVDPPDGLAMAPSEPLCGLSPTAFAVQLPDMSQPHPAVLATRDQASNKLLYAAALRLNIAGNWHLRAYVSRGSDSARFDCLLPITEASAETTGLWPYLVFPPIAILAFGMNQWLGRHSLEKGFQSQSVYRAWASR